VLGRLRFSLTVPMLTICAAARLRLIATILDPGTIRAMLRSLAVATGAAVVV